MNKQGKGSNIFIILVPIFLIAALIIADTAVTYNADKTFKKVTEEIIEEVLNNDELSYDEYNGEIKRLYELKGYETEMLLVDANSYQIYVENEHEYFGVFTSIFGNGKEEIVKVFGIFDFKMKKGSKTSLKVEARFDSNDELQFEYVE